jgi:toxin ParE1/3/4
MNLPLVVSPAARVDVLDAQNWYDRQRAGLGDVFGLAVEKLFDQIVSMPTLYGVAEGDVRQAGVSRFPYCVYYLIMTDRVEVVAVLHASRDPQVWQSRI